MKKFVVLLSVLFLVSLYTLPTYAFTNEVGDPSDGQAGSYNYIGTSDGSIAPVKSNTYGTNPYIELNVGSHGFIPLNDGQWAHLYSGWSYRNDGTNTGTCANINLPSGALVSGVTTWTNDTDATYNISYEFYAVDLTTNTDTEIFAFTTTGSPGIQRTYRAFTSPITIDNDRMTYSLCIFHYTTGSTLQNAGATFWYNLQVSPAPAIATFGDVPISNPFFKYVEALVNSGITAGCGSGNYCPDNYVTRGQMAVFLSKALGLHWPDL